MLRGTRMSGSVAGILLLAHLVGCSGDPLYPVHRLNPVIWDQWEQDEQYAPTLHRQLDEVAEVRRSASSMDRVEQVHWCQEFTHILQQHPQPILREAVVRALADFGVPEADEALKIANQDEDAAVRIAACRAWGLRPGETAIAQLAELLGRDTDLDVRLAAARQLGRFRQRQSLDALGLVLGESHADPALKHRVIESLRQVSGRDYGSDSAAWLAYIQGRDPGPEHSPSLAERLDRWF